MILGFGGGGGGGVGMFLGLGCGVADCRQSVKQFSSTYRVRHHGRTDYSASTGSSLGLGQSSGVCRVFAFRLCGF